MALLCLAVGPALAPRALAQQRIELPVAGRVTQPIVLHEAAHPTAIAVLFPGGNGAIAAVRNNFLLRVAERFAAAGITVAAADVPSDHAYGVEKTWRASPAQAADTAVIVAFLRRRTAMRVWLIGTSNGSISAANAAVRLGPEQIAGVVLTSAVWDGGMRQVPLADIRVPALIVHNARDGCAYSPYGGAVPALAALTSVPDKALVTVSSSAQFGSPCEAKSPHGYLGIEDDVVQRIVGWIKQH